MKKIPSLLPIFYGLHFLFCAACFVWIFLDPRFEAAVSWWKYRPGSDELRSISEMGDWQSLRFRCWFSYLSMAGLFGSVGLVLVTFIAGQSYGRSIRSWAVFSLLFGFWLTLFLNWENVAWSGKAFRMRPLLFQLEKIADELSGNWPQKDGVDQTLGAFMAYPVGNPRTLILLELPEFSGCDATVAAVEKDRSSIRMELSGSEVGDWIEWHPKGIFPNSFRSSMGQLYTLDKFQLLRDRWFLVRYEK